MASMGSSGEGFKSFNESFKSKRTMEGPTPTQNDALYAAMLRNLHGEWEANALQNAAKIRAIERKSDDEHTAILTRTRCEKEEIEDRKMWAGEVALAKIAILQKESEAKLRREDETRMKREVEEAKARIQGVEEKRTPGGVDMSMDVDDTEKAKPGDWAEFSKEWHKKHDATTDIPLERSSPFGNASSTKLPPPRYRPNGPAHPGMDPDARWH